MTVPQSNPDIITARELEELRAENARLRHDLTELARLVVEQTAAEEARRRTRRRGDIPNAQDTLSRLYPADETRR
ncbi:MAG: hypothetical protein ACR2OH_05835 [Microthrixaceae bacterium]